MRTLHTPFVRIILPSNAGPGSGLPYIDLNGLTDQILFVDATGFTVGVLEPGLFQLKQLTGQTLSMKTSGPGPELTFGLGGGYTDGFLSADQGALFAPQLVIQSPQLAANTVASFTLTGGASPATANAAVTTSAGGGLVVDGVQVVGAENGVNGVSAGDTTVSGAFVSMVGANTSFNLGKIYDQTRIRVDMSIGSFSTAINTQTDFGVLVNGVDYQITRQFFNNANEHLVTSGSLYIPANTVPKGVQGVIGRWARTSGAGTASRNGGDWISITARECA